MTKTRTWLVRTAKTQISLGIRPVWSESFLSAWRKLGSLATHWAHSEDSDRTGRMPRLIWDFAGRTVILLVLSWGGSFVVLARLVSWAGLEFDCIGSWSLHAVSSTLPFLVFCHQWNNATYLDRYKGMLNKAKWETAWQNRQNDLCTQRRLGSAWASAQSDQSSLSAWRKFGSLATHKAHIKGSDQTGRMPRLILIWVFAGRTSYFVGFVMRRLKCAKETFLSESRMMLMDSDRIHR